MGLVCYGGGGGIERANPADAHTHVVAQGLTPYCNQIVTVLTAIMDCCTSLFRRSCPIEIVKTIKPKFHFIIDPKVLLPLRNSPDT